MSEDEKWFDENIAPVLLELANKCGERGMAFVAGVQYGPAECDFQRTVRLPEKPSLRMVMLAHCAKMGNNIDGYAMGLLKYCKENGIGYDASMVLMRLDGKI